MRCNFCGGAAHPATGCQYGQRVIACRSCTESFWRWVDKHTASRRTKARRETVEGMKVFELTQDEYERQSVAIAGTAGTLDLNGNTLTVSSLALGAGAAAASQIIGDGSTSKAAIGGFSAG